MRCILIADLKSSQNFSLVNGSTSKLSHRTVCCPQSFATLASHSCYISIDFSQREQRLNKSKTVRERQTQRQKQTGRQGQSRVFL